MSTRSLGFLAGIGVVTFVSLTLNQTWDTDKPYSQIAASQPPLAIAVDSHTYTIEPNNISDSVVAQAPSPKSPSIADLNLSQAQKRKIDRIRRQYQPQINQLKAELQVAQQQLSQMMYGTEAMDIIRLQHQQMVELSDQITILRFESMLQMREVLSPDQRTQLAQILRDRQAQIESNIEQSVNP